jgi:D-alanyl-D-alanine carboxypeptidase (penicillin-binding protein 5/6)
MTALVARDYYNLDEILEIPVQCTNLDSSNVGFTFGEKVSVSDLISSLLISSAGDSACTLAYQSDSYDRFISSMNTKALDAGLKSTNFSNPVGIDDFSENHLASAYDLYQLALLVRDDPVLKDIVAIKEFNIETGNINRKIFNTNDLLWNIPGTVGIKTGRTYGAGEVLIYEYAYDGVNILIVVMGSLDRFKDTTAILDWTLASYTFNF